MPNSSIFDREEYKPYKNAWDQRLAELTRRRGYYDGTVYNRYRQQLSWFGPRFYRGIKPLYLPLSRAVDVDVGIVPGNWSFIPGAPESWIDARNLLWSWSSWATEGCLFVHYGAEYGLSGLKVADLRDQKKIVLKPVDPTKFMLVYSDQYDDTPDMSIFVELREDTGTLCEYAEIVTPEAIYLFENGEPKGVGDRPAQYENKLGFVPYVEIQHVNVGKNIGDATYQAAMPMLDEVNQLASYLADIIAKHTEPQWAVMGSEPADLEKSGDNVWFFARGTDVKPIVAGLDIDGVLKFVQTIADNVRGALPELAFDDLKSKTQVATATLELQLMELTLKVKRMRPNYDSGMVKALRMAGRAAESMGLPEVAVLDDELLALDDERPVIPLDPEARAALELKQIEVEKARRELEATSQNT